MSQNSLNVAQSEEIFRKWVKNNCQNPNPEGIKFRILRDKFISKYKELKAESKNSMSRSWYTIDVEFGLFIYSYFEEMNWFTLRIAEDDGFWRFLSVNVMPDLVKDRWGLQEDHFYSRGTRIWFKTLWWYVYLSWQGNLDDTRVVLLNKNMNTDVIQNLVERSGRNGVYVEVYRKIMKFYSTISTEQLKELEKSIKQNKERDTFFRNIMKLNTAKMMLVEPGLFEDEENGYVHSLFSELGVNVNET